MYNHYCFCIYIKRLKLERRAGSGNGFCNVVSNAAYWQRYVTYLVYFDFLVKAVHQ